jgi:hypothetical protein
VGAEILHADGRTDGQTDIAFRNFANMPFLGALEKEEVKIKGVVIDNFILGGWGRQSMTP